MEMPEEATPQEKTMNENVPPPLLSEQFRKKSKHTEAVRRRSSVKETKNVDDTHLDELEQTIQDQIHQDHVLRVKRKSTNHERRISLGKESLNPLGQAIAEAVAEAEQDRALSQKLGVPVDESPSKDGNAHMDTTQSSTSHTDKIGQEVNSISSDDSVTQTERSKSNSHLNAGPEAVRLTNCNDTKQASRLSAANLDQHNQIQPPSPHDASESMRKLSCASTFTDASVSTADGGSFRRRSQTDVFLTECPEAELNPKGCCIIA